MTFPDTLPPLDEAERLRVNAILIAKLARLLGWSS